MIYDESFKCMGVGLTDGENGVLFSLILHRRALPICCNFTPTNGNVNICLFNFGINHFSFDFLIVSPCLFNVWFVKIIFMSPACEANL